MIQTKSQKKTFKAFTQELTYTKATYVSLAKARPYHPYHERIKYKMSTISYISHITQDMNT